MFDQLGDPTPYGFEMADVSKEVEYSLVIPHEGIQDFNGPRDASLSVHYPLTPPTSSCPSSPFSVLSSPYSSVSSPRPRDYGSTLCTSDFRPIRVLGKGGHGTVYLVEDVVTERLLAMKVIEKNGLRLREYPAVFEEQAVARALTATPEVGDTACGRAHFVALQGSFEDSDNFYFLTDYYPQGDMTKLLKRQGRVSEDQARQWCAELLVALEHLHIKRIVHRDIKPDNILLDQDGHIVLADFGIARAFKRKDADRPWKRVHPWGWRASLDESSEDRPTGAKGKDEDVTHSLVGTAGYIAPEVYSGKYSYGVDVWGVGVVLYCMLVGKLPFGLDPKQQRLEEIIARTDNVPVDFDLYGVVDADVRDLLTKMLEKDPRKRPTIRKLKKHRWFRGISWNELLRRPPTGLPRQLDINPEVEEEFDIPYGRPYGTLEKLPHPWFEWVSPNLRDRTSSAISANWSLASSSYSMIDIDEENDESFEMLRRQVTVANVLKGPNVVQKMRGWLKRRMSIS
ncbi:kinase-like protein [Trametes cingulata]|nr:kinase-like protein [Trametes cingulata]